MSNKNSQILLKRIEQPTILHDRIQPKNEVKPVAPDQNPNLLSLIHRVETRRWVEETKLLLEQRIDELKNELKLMKHALNCWQCMMELQLDVERYMGTRSFWWLDLNNDAAEMFDDCPRVENYRIGSYWTGTSDDTKRFIKDRIEWARKLVMQELRNTGKARSLLEHWDYSQIDECLEEYDSLMA